MGLGLELLGNSYAYVTFVDDGRYKWSRVNLIQDDKMKHNPPKPPVAMKAAEPPE